MPAQSITLVQDCGITKGSPNAYSQADVETAVDAILSAVETGRSS